MKLAVSGKVRKALIFVSLKLTFKKIGDRKRRKK